MIEPPNNAIRFIRAQNGGKLEEFKICISGYILLFRSIYCFGFTYLNVIVAMIYVNISIRNNANNNTYLFTFRKSGMNDIATETRRFISKNKSTMLYIILPDASNVHCNLDGINNFTHIALNE